jgi:mono/diheme cytochrome c family protein
MTARSAHLRYAIAIGSALALAACASPRARSPAQMSGMQIYEHLCSSCHGVDGRGEGPVASLLTIVVPDLTRIAQRAGGEFPAEDVRRTIDGRWDRRAHGARDMSVWGWQFYDSAAASDVQERARVDAMITRLVDYLRSIQVQ